MHGGGQAHDGDYILQTLSALKSFLAFAKTSAADYKGPLISVGCIIAVLLTMTKEEVKTEREVYHEEHAEDLAHDDVVDHKLERKLLFKLDALILPLTALLYLSAL